MRGVSLDISNDWLNPFSTCLEQERRREPSTLIAVQRAIDLLDELSHDAAAADDAIGALELRLASSLVQQGKLDRAHELLESVALPSHDANRQLALAEQWQRLARAWR